MPYVEAYHTTQHFRVTMIPHVNNKEWRSKDFTSWALDLGPVCKPTFFCMCGFRAAAMEAPCASSIVVLKNCMSRKIKEWLPSVRTGRSPTQRNPFWQKRWTLQKFLGRLLGLPSNGQQGWKVVWSKCIPTRAPSNFHMMSPDILEGNYFAKL